MALFSADGLARGYFANVLGTLVHGAEQAVEPIAEGGVALGAAHAANLLQLRLRESAGRAGRLLALFGSSGGQEGFRKAEAHRVGHPLLLGAGLTQVHGGHLPIDDLGQKHRGFFAANVALHPVNQYGTGVPSELAIFVNSSTRRSVMGPGLPLPM